MEVLNLFGAEIKLNFNGKPQYLTNFGLNLSFLFLMLIGLFTFLIGRDFIKRHNPKSSYTSAFNENYLNIDLNTYEFNFMFGFVDFYLTQIEDDPYISINPLYYRYKENFFEEYIPLNVTKCNTAKSDNKFYDSKFSSFKCIDFNNTSLFGGMESAEFYGMSIIIKFCDDKEICFNKTFMNEYLKEKNYFLFFSVNDVQYETNNYKNGLNIYPKVIDLLLDIEFQTVKIFFEKIDLITDYGWLFKNIKTSSKLGYHSHVILQNDVNRSIMGAGENSLVSILFFVNKKSTEIYREFSKIQTLIAELGGLLNFLMIIFYKLSNIYSLNQLKIRLFNSLESIKEENLRKLKEISDLSNLKNANIVIDKNNQIKGLNELKIKDNNCNKELYEINRNSKEKLNTCDSIGTIDIEKEQIPISNKFTNLYYTNFVDNNSSKVRKSNISNNSFTICSISKNYNSVNIDRCQKINNYENADKSRKSSNTTDNNNENTDNQVPINSIDIKINVHKKALRTAIQNINKIKKLEEDDKIGIFDPFEMFCQLNCQCLFSCCLSDPKSDKFEKYKFITKVYDDYFEFHNIMLLENKVDVLSNYLEEMT